MMVDRGLGARLRYRMDQFMARGPAYQLSALAAVVGFTVASTVLVLLLVAPGGDEARDALWWAFTRVLDPGTMADDDRLLIRALATGATIMGLLFTGMLISLLTAGLEERLEDMKQGRSAVIEKDHFLVLGWSEKVFPLIDQLAQGAGGDDQKKKEVVVVVLAERDKLEMEDELRDRVEADNVRVVVRSGSTVSGLELARVAVDQARAIVVLIDEYEAREDAQRADAHVVKTLMAIRNHALLRERDCPPITAEILIEQNEELAMIAGEGVVSVANPTDIIGKVILQTARVSGLSEVYEELLRYDGMEFHHLGGPAFVGKTFEQVMLGCDNCCPVGIHQPDGSCLINPPRDHVMAAGEELIVVAEDEGAAFAGSSSTLERDAERALRPPMGGRETQERMLVLGWNEKVHLLATELDGYALAGSTITYANELPVAEREEMMAEVSEQLENVAVEHIRCQYINRKAMEALNPESYDTVLVLGDITTSKGAEAADTKAILALLLLRNCRRQAGVEDQTTCSEILIPRNRELANITRVDDVVISNHLFALVLSQITIEPRIKPILDHLFMADGSEIYLKPIDYYVEPGTPISFRQLQLRALDREECLFGWKRADSGEGIQLNPSDRDQQVVFKEGDQLVVLAEEDG